MPYKYRDREIAKIPKFDRPREKLVQYGVSRLSNAELLALILRTGRKGENVVSLSERILRKFSSRSLSTIAYDDLLEIKGLGQAKASQIIACFELGKRLMYADNKKKLFLSPQDIWRGLYDIRDNKKEYFVVFYLDARSQEISREIISIGTIDKSIVHPREVFEPAVRLGAAHIILAHNHPTGDPTPSDNDVMITRRLVDAGAIMGIDILDHIIVTKEDFLSFKVRGLL